MIRTLLAALGLSFVAGCYAHPSMPVAHDHPEARHVYRVDIVVAANDPGKPASSSAYTLNVLEHSSGEVRMGTNVPLSPSQARIDVGLKIVARVDVVGGALVMQDSVEMSDVDTGTVAPTSIHKITTSGEAVLDPGHPALVASLEDPTSHRHYEVTAAATVLR